MSIANQKGGFSTTLRVEQNNSNEAMCMLDKPLLKKSENWSLQLTDFFINKTQPLNLALGQQLIIVPFAQEGFSDGWKDSDYTFTPIKCYTVAEYAMQLQTFFHRFSFLFWKFGVNLDAQGANITKGLTPAEIQLLITANFDDNTVNYVKSNIVGVEEGFINLPEICRCFIDNHLKFNIRLQPIFLLNFFIDCSDEFTSRLGMPSFIYAVPAVVPAPDPDPGVNISIGTVMFDYVAPVQANGYPQFSAEVLLAYGAGQQVLQVIDFPSEFTIRELDDRLSLDVVCTFPSSRKIVVLNGVEEHEFLLARFDLSSYKEFEGVTTQNFYRMLETTEFSETFQAGLENLTRSNPNFESNLLLPGSIQQIHLMLYTRYLEDNEIKTVKTDMNDGFFHIRMLFSKKI